MTVKFVIAGYEGCGYHAHAVRAGQELARGHPDVEIEIITLPRSEFKASIPEWRKGLGPAAQHHETSPFVWKEENGNREFVGGCDDFLAFIQANY